jgi:hypothetical protein
MPGRARLAAVLWSVFGFLVLLGSLLFLFRVVMKLNQPQTAAGN